MRNPINSWRSASLIFAAALTAVTITSAGASAVAAAELSAPERPGVQVADTCTDWGINGWGDCKDFVAACGKGGGHAHALNRSGLLPSVTYSCHSGRTHQNGD